MIRRMIAKVAPFLVLSFLASPAWCAPRIFFTDIESGPNVGGENNNGAFVTLYGTQFGSGPTVTVGGGQAIIKQSTTAHLWYQKLVIQLGAAARSGNIVLSSGGQSSNGVPFTVRSGDIYFVSAAGQAPTSGCATANSDGSFAKPWKFDSAHGPLYYTNHNGYGQACVGAGDILYLMHGVSFTGDDGRGWGASWSIENVPGTSAANPVAYLAYPGAQVQIGGERNYGIRWISGSNMIVGGLRVAGKVEGGIAVAENTKTVGNYVTCPTCDSADGVIAGEVGNVRVYGNEVTLVSTSLSNGSQKLFHSMYFGGSNIDVGWNRIHNVRSYNGIQINHDGTSGFYNVDLHHNEIANQYGHGIALATIDPSRGYVRVRENIIRQTHYACIYLGDYQSASASGTVEITNNTLYDCSRSLNTENISWDGCAILKNGTKSNVTMQLKNNIIFQPTYTYSNTQNAYICNIPSALSQYAGTNNLWFGDGAGPSQTSSNLNTGPNFVNATSANFRLQAGSPAINAGVSISGEQLDLDGTLRPQGGSFDLGAFEFVSGGGGDTLAPASPSDLTVAP